MEYDLSCRLAYQVDQRSTFMFHVAADGAVQDPARESVRTTPDLPVETLSTPRGRIHRVCVEEPGPFELSYTASGFMQAAFEPAETLMEVPSAEWPAEVIEFVYPSRYCESDLLFELAHETFGGLERGYARVLAVCRWIHERLVYESFSSGPTTTATETLNAGRGVCRDFAHAGIALCRALNIPARFVSAYAPGLEPPDFHACFEAYLSHRWWLFDPTFMVPRSGILRIGTGRDAAGVSFATILGWVTFHDMAMSVNVRDLAPDVGWEAQALTLDVPAMLAKEAGP